MTMNRCSEWSSPPSSSSSRDHDEPAHHRHHHQQRRRRGSHRRVVSNKQPLAQQQQQQQQPMTAETNADDESSQLPPSPTIDEQRPRQPQQDQSQGEGLAVRDDDDQPEEQQMSGGSRSASQLPSASAAGPPTTATPTMGCNSTTNVAGPTAGVWHCLVCTFINTQRRRRNRCSMCRSRRLDDEPADEPSEPNSSAARASTGHDIKSPPTPHQEQQLRRSGKRTFAQQQQKERMQTNSQTLEDCAGDDHVSTGRTRTWAPKRRGTIGDTVGRCGGGAVDEGNPSSNRSCQTMDAPQRQSQPQQHRQQQQPTAKEQQQSKFGNESPTVNAQNKAEDSSTVNTTTTPNPRLLFVPEETSLQLPRAGADDDDCPATKMTPTMTPAQRADSVSHQLHQSSPSATDQISSPTDLEHFQNRAPPPPDHHEAHQPQNIREDAVCGNLQSMNSVRKQEIGFSEPLVANTASCKTHKSLCCSPRDGSTPSDARRLATVAAAISNADDDASRQQRPCLLVRCNDDDCDGNENAEVDEPQTTHRFAGCDDQGAPTLKTTTGATNHNVSKDVLNSIYQQQQNQQQRHPAVQNTRDPRAKPTLPRGATRQSLHDKSDKDKSSYFASANCFAWTPRASKQSQHAILQLQASLAELQRSHRRVVQQHRRDTSEWEQIRQQIQALQARQAHQWQEALKEQKSSLERTLSCHLQAVSEQAQLQMAAAILAGTSDDGLNDDAEDHGTGVPQCPSPDAIHDHDVSTMDGIDNDNGCYFKTWSSNCESMDYDRLESTVGSRSFSASFPTATSKTSTSGAITINSTTKHNSNHDILERASCAGHAPLSEGVPLHHHNPLVTNESQDESMTWGAAAKDATTAYATATSADRSIATTAKCKATHPGDDNDGTGLNAQLQPIDDSLTPACNQYHPHRSQSAIDPTMIVRTVAHETPIVTTALTSSAGPRKGMIEPNTSSPATASGYSSLCLKPFVGADLTKDGGQITHFEEDFEGDSPKQKQEQVDNFVRAATDPVADAINLIHVNHSKMESPQNLVHENDTIVANITVSAGHGGICARGMQFIDAMASCPDIGPPFLKACESIPLAQNNNNTAIASSTPYTIEKDNNFPRPRATASHRFALMEARIDGPTSDNKENSVGIVPRHSGESAVDERIFMRQEQSHRAGYGTNNDNFPIRMLLSQNLIKLPPTTTATFISDHNLASTSNDKTERPTFERPEKESRGSEQVMSDAPHEPLLVDYVSAENPRAQNRRNDQYESSCVLEDNSDINVMTCIPIDPNGTKKTLVHNSTNRKAASSSSLAHLTTYGWISNGASRKFVRDLNQRPEREGAEFDGNRSNPVEALSAPAPEPANVKKPPGSGRVNRWLSSRAAANKYNPGSASSASNDLWDDEPKYPYQETVRCKKDRQALPCHDCHECRRYYQMMNETGMLEHMSQDPMLFSRHRARHAPTETPEDFWEIDFIDERDAYRKLQQAHRKSV